MLYRSKFLSRRKQDRVDQERLNDLFVISHEQHEFDSILHPTTGDGIDNDQDGRHQRGISSATSSSTGMGERTSHLVREYDPIDGEYTLILDSPSMRSPASRKTVTATTTPKDSPSSIRRESLSIPMSPSAVRATSRLRRSRYVSSTATTDTEEEEGSQKSEDPSFVGWPGEPLLQEEEPVQQTAVGDRPEDLFSKPFDSKISRISRSLFDDSSQEGGSNSIISSGGGSSTRSQSRKEAVGSASPKALSTPSKSTPSRSPRTVSPGSVDSTAALSMVPPDEDPQDTDPRTMPPSTPTQPEPRGLEEKGQGHRRHKFDLDGDSGPQSTSHSPPPFAPGTATALPKEANATEVPTLERIVLTD